VPLFFLTAQGFFDQKISAEDAGIVPQLRPKHPDDVASDGYAFRFDRRPQRIPEQNKIVRHAPADDDPLGIQQINGPDQNKTQMMTDVLPETDGLRVAFLRERMDILKADVLPMEKPRGLGQERGITDITFERFILIWDVADLAGRKMTAPV
jgi:hypothetical protein